MRSNVWVRYTWIALALLALCLLVAGGLLYRSLWARYDSALGQLEARSERLEGIVKSGPQIEALLTKAQSNVSPWVHPGGENAPNDVQQKLRELIVNSGSTLVSSQVALEPATDGQMAHIRLTATVSGDWSKLVRFMEALQARLPPFWVQSVIVSRDGASNGPGPQGARLALQLEAPLAPIALQKGQP
ncbi:type II secretion system protein GspM [Simplicispira suum]|uniref:General secretion pathway protein GspM n=1 Tax=Simplicispira suum TaxID=2109915 RepID=A0A2S0MXW6_9BURK|nr:type II secretion system protein GspM [Simplicispira suum]AVO40728.1 general secretion pathway protein GspM [Simplicispira suum]